MAPRSPRARAWLVATACCVAGIAGIALWIGPSAVIGPWDVFTLLNGGYRIYLGQAPGAQFANPIGPLAYGLVALGMHLQRTPSLRAVVYSQVMFLVIAATMAWVVSWRRLPALYAAIFTVFVAFIAVGVRPLGFSQWQMSYAMLYNRDGWLLYAILLMLVFLPRRIPARANRQLIADGLMLGLLLGLIFYDKITFFIAALAATALALVLRTLPRDRQVWMAAVAGVVTIGVLFRLVFRVHTTAYISDFIQAAEVQVAGQRTGMAEQTLKWTSPLILLVLAVAGLLFMMARRRAEPWQPTLRLLAAAGYVLISSLAISAGDAPERNDLPALVIIPLLVIAFFESRLPWWAGGQASARPRGWSPRPYQALLVGLALLLAGTTVPIAAREALALGRAESYRGYVANPPPSQTFEAAPLRDFVIPAGTTYVTAYRNAGDLPAMINNGLVLLRHDVRPGQGVFTVGYTDPFDMALHLPLSSCGPLWWDLGFDFDARHHPTAQCVIGTDAWVIIPRMIPGQGCCQQTVSVMLSLYSGYLSRYYHQYQETPDWILLRRDGTA
ncbi:MAG: hypothetical protein JWM19_7073 [Actinomycetia bacterium]|nr:hypothetical protein [Actinomycetes bacterium]